MAERDDAFSSVFGGARGRADTNRERAKEQPPAVYLRTGDGYAIRYTYERGIVQGEVWDQRERRWGASGPQLHAEAMLDAKRIILQNGGTTIDTPDGVRFLPFEAVEQIFAWLEPLHRP